MNKLTGGPAFPVLAGTGEDGMTLRDYFAAKAMQAQIGMSYLYAHGGQTYANLPNMETTAKDAYAFADAMLKERQA